MILTVNQIQVGIHVVLMKCFKDGEVSKINKCKSQIKCCSMVTQVSDWIGMMINFET